MVALYDVLLPQVYGYLLDRCGNRAIAEDLTSETFLAAVTADAGPDPGAVSAPGSSVSPGTSWRTTRRRRSRDERLGEQLHPVDVDDPWDATLDQLTAGAVLDRLRPDHRSVLTFRYLDSLPVPDVAVLLGRSVHATESLLVRARAALRVVYEQGDGDA